MNCSQRKSGSASRLLALFVAFLVNLFLCSADYTLRTKNPVIVNISTILTPAFARNRGPGTENSDFVGFIPELLKALKDRKGIAEHYRIIPATGNAIGQKEPNKNWTGLMSDVLSGKGNVIGAGPILNSSDIKNQVQLSESFATVFLTLVVKNNSNVTNLREALNMQTTILAVRESPELAEIGKQAGTNVLKELGQRIHQDKRYVGTVYDGLKAVASEENSAQLMNTEEARYYVTHDFCDLRTLPNFHPLGEYVFVLDRDSLHSNALNKQLQEMKRDGSLETIRSKELGTFGTCSKGSILPLERIFTLLFAAATVSFARILS